MRNMLPLVALFVAWQLASSASAQVYVAPTPSTPPSTVHHMDHGFVAAGTVLFLVTWTLNIGGSCAGSLTSSTSGPDNVRNYDLASTIPVVGPMVQFAFADTIEWTLPIVALMDAAQIAGLVMMIIGAIGVDDEVGTASSAPSWTITPMVSASLAGMQLGGTFD